MRAQLWSSPRLLVAALLIVAATACSRSESAVQADVQQQLASDPATSSAQLTVSVSGGVARISGDTDSLAQQNRALDIARAVKGVDRVESAMRLNDAALARTVREAIAADPQVSTVPLTVEAEDGDVRLISDQTNAEQRARLVAIAQGVTGVTRVEDRMK